MTPCLGSSAACVAGCTGPALIGSPTWLSCSSLPCAQLHARGTASRSTPPPHTHTPLQVSHTQDLTKSLLVTGFGYEHDECWATNIELFKHFTDVTQVGGHAPGRPGHGPAGADRHPSLLADAASKGVLHPITTHVPLSGCHVARLCLQGVRRLGSAAVDMCHVASGELQRLLQHNWLRAAPRNAGAPPWA